MATYANAASLDPEQFANMYSDPYSGGYTDLPVDDENEDAVEDALAAHDGAAVAGPADWKQIIAQIAPAPKLSLGATYRREAEDPKHRMGDLLEGCFRVYQQKSPGDPSGVDQ